MDDITLLGTVVGKRLFGSQENAVENTRIRYNSAERDAENQRNKQPCVERSHADGSVEKRCSAFSESGCMRFFDVQPWFEQQRFRSADQLQTKQRQTATFNHDIDR